MNMFDVSLDPCYHAVAGLYRDRTTKRSGVRLMNHIDEGLVVLARIDATREARRAYCLHPLVQSDEALKQNLRWLRDLPGDAVALAMEYRRVANNYLSPRRLSSIDDIELSPLKDVNDMLVADKIQNRKDFETYHAQTHPRAADLKQYFKNWMQRLAISDEFYAERVQALASKSGS